MTEPDLNRMTRDEIVTWFQDTDSLAPVVRTMRPAPASGTAPEAPMMLVSIQLPVSLVERLDQLAEQATASRSDLIRDALIGYVDARVVTPPARPGLRGRDITEQSQAWSDGAH